MVLLWIIFKDNHYTNNFNNNYIIAEININENNINKEIRMINSFENKKEKIK